HVLECEGAALVRGGRGQDLFARSAEFSAVAHGGPLAQVDRGADDGLTVDVHHGARGGELARRDILRVGESGRWQRKKESRREQEGVAVHERPPEWTSYGETDYVSGTPETPRRPPKPGRHQGPRGRP